MKGVQGIMRLSPVPDRLFDAYDRVTPEILRGMGVRLLLCDLDYTLAPKRVREPDEKLRRWIGEMKAAGIQVMILSNNRSPARVERFCGDLGIAYEGHAGKPFARVFRRAVERAGVAAGETAMLGDKLLTDVLCAHFNGCPALMVEPAGGPVTLLQKALHAMQEPFKRMNRRKRA